jgi:Family of unknown function (DUF5995)
VPTRTRILIGATTVAALVAAALPGSAPGQGTGPLPNWPELLPPNPSNSAEVVWPGFDVCQSGDVACPREVILEMYERWRPLSQACDHRAVFALTYLRTTEEYFRTVQGEPGFFDDPQWVNHEDAVFARFYFRAEDAYRGGDPVPEAWRIAFESAKSPNLTGASDLLLGMSAHINRDLPFTLAAVGLVPAGGGSRKTDHDRVNFFLDRIADPLQEELGARYDPFFETSDGGPLPFDEIGVLAAVRSFRQGAWQNAERLVNAADEEERDQVAAGIEAYSTVQAQAIVAANTIPGWGETRDAWCREHNPASAKLDVRGKRRGVLRRGRLKVWVWADGPARFELRGFLEPAAVKLTRRGEVSFEAEGWQRASLKLTRRGRRALARRGPARVCVALDAPYGFGVQATHTLR